MFLPKTIIFNNNLTFQLIMLRYRAKGSKGFNGFTRQGRLFHAA